MPARFLRTSSEHLQEAARLAHLARDGDLDDVVRQVCAVMASVHEQMAHALAGAAMSASAPPRCDDRPPPQAASSRRRCPTGAWTLRRAATSLERLAGRSAASKESTAQVGRPLLHRYDRRQALAD